MTFDEFLLAFFDIFQRKGFPGGSFHAYLDKTMTGDEAPIVDKAVVGPLLNLLGFDDAEQVYNEQKQGDRPDFAPSDSAYGTCFFVEDKATGLDLTLDLTNPDSHLSQLSRYVRAGGARSGWLTNGRRLIAWRFDDPTNPTRILDLDVAAALRAWRPDDPASLPDAPAPPCKRCSICSGSPRSRTRSGWSVNSPSIWTSGGVRRFRSARAPTAKRFSSASCKPWCATFRPTRAGFCKSVLKAIAFIGISPSGWTTTRRNVPRIRSTV